MGKLPSFQFYPGDWLKDPAVRSVSLAARGLWIDLLCLMHESPRRGYLQHKNGKPVTHEQIARMTGCSSEEVSRLLQELEDSGVCSCTKHGTIYCRRMVREETKRQLCREAGKRGGNPLLVRHPHDRPLIPPKVETLKGRVKGGVKGEVKGGVNPISSSSNSSSRNTHPPNPPPSSAIAKALELLGPQWGCVCEELVSWFAYLESQGKPVLDPPQQAVDICRMFASPEDLLQAIRTARANRWVTLKPDMAGRPPTANPIDPFAV